MKKIIPGIMFILIVILSIYFYNPKIYEFYDLSGKYGTSSNCELTISGAECLINKKMEIVNQFSKIGEEL